MIPGVLKAAKNKQTPMDAAPQGVVSLEKHDVADSRRILKLAGRAGCILLINGAEIFRVQETMLHVLNAFGIVNCNVFVVSNGIFATVNEGTPEALSLVRYLPLGTVNLSRIDMVNQVSRSICAGELDLSEAEALLDRAETFMPERPFMHVLACGVGAAGFCYLFGGSIPDSVAALLIGMALQPLLFFLQKKNTGFIKYIWGSLMVTLLSGMAAMVFPALDINRIVIGSIIALVPGVVFSTSIREFFNGDYLSGVIHLISALITAVCIALGVCGAILIFSMTGGLPL
jgi:uncharacterized membrane protein YjjP (DUF1212 family)